MDYVIKDTCIEKIDSEKCQEENSDCLKQFKKCSMTNNKKVCEPATQNLVSQNLHEDPNSTFFVQMQNEK